jgi:glycosyltransferase involved in cell wall biosynthesis
MDVMALPSRLEATPMCLLEAMAAGIPVVATRVGGIPNVVTTGVTGILVEAEDVKELADALLFLLEDSELAQSMARQARVHVARHFSAEAMAEHYANLYHEALRCHCSVN